MELSKGLWSGHDFEDFNTLVLKSEHFEMTDPRVGRFRELDVIENYLDDPLSWRIELNLSLWLDLAEIQDFQEINDFLKNGHILTL